jgi:hypothetical protein
MSLKPICTAFLLMVGTLVASTAIAAPSVPPVAKFVDKIKVLDSKNKTVGFIDLNEGMNFKVGNHFFMLRVGKDGLYGGVSYYGTDDCSGTPSLMLQAAVQLNPLHENAIVIKRNDGYDVYMPDLDTPEIEASGDTIKSYKQDLGSLLLGPGAPVASNECQIIDWVGSSNTFQFAPGQKFRLGKLLAKLPFTPPFTLK